MNGGHPAIVPGTLPLRTIVVLFLEEDSSRTEYAGLDLGLVASSSTMALCCQI